MRDDPELIPFEPPRAPGVRALFRNIIETFPRALYDEPGMMRYRTPISDAVFITDPDLIQEVLVSRVDEFRRDDPARQMLTPVLGEHSVILAEGADWRWHRRALAPAFRHELLLSLTPAIDRAARRQVERWRRLPAGAPVNVVPHMTRVALEVIVESLFGQGFSMDLKAYGEAMDALVASLPWVTAMAALRAPSWTPYPARRRTAASGAWFLSQVEAEAAERRTRTSASPALFDVLARAVDAENGRAMSPAELAGNLIALLNAGHETSAATLGWTLWLLAKYPDVQDQVAAEAFAVMGEGPIQAQRLYDLSFTRQVVQEAMRLYPPVPMVSRQPVGRLVLGGERLERSTQISLATYALHRNRRLWEHPNAFDPGHFAPERIKARHRYAYLAFGAGPRICIGSGLATIEVLTVLATLLRAFRVRPMEGRVPYPIARVSLRARGGVRLYVEPR